MYLNVCEIRRYCQIAQTINAQLSGCIWTETRASSGFCMLVPVAGAWV